MDLSLISSFNNFFHNRPVVHIDKQTQPIHEMLWLTFLIFSAWKIAVKAFGFVFYVLDCSFHETFLIRRMKMMMFNIWEYACLWIRCPFDCCEMVFSIFSNQGLYKPFSHKRDSFNGGANTRKRLISWLHSNPQTYIVVISHFNQCFIYDEFRWFASRLEHLL